MFRLLTLRILPLFLRPAAVVLEGTILTDQNILVITLPIVAITLILSSIPIHLNYFRGTATRSTQNEVADLYISSLTVLSIAATLLLAILLATLPLRVGMVLGMSICTFFLAEKLTDEVARTLEFRREFNRWFFIQLMRSVWLLLPIGVASRIGSYEEWFLFFSVVYLGAMAAAFFKIVQLRPRITMRAFSEIWSNLPYLTGATLPAIYRNMPRLLIAGIFPKSAHLFLSLSQVCQGVSIVFDVRYILPFRKMIARKPGMFQRRLSVLLNAVLLAASVVAVLYLALLSRAAWNMDSVVLSTAILTPILLFDSLVFSALAAMLGITQWSLPARRAMTINFLCISMLLPVLGLSAIFWLKGAIGPIHIIVTNIFIGVLWTKTLMIRVRSESEKCLRPNP